MNEVDRRSCLACLAAIEANMAELRGTESWWKMLAAVNQQEWLEVMSWVRVYQHDLSQ